MFHLKLSYDDATHMIDASTKVTYPCGLLSTLLAPMNAYTEWVKKSAVNDHL